MRKNLNKQKNGGEKSDAEANEGTASRRRKSRWDIAEPNNSPSSAGVTPAGPPTSREHLREVSRDEH
jgi:hypothetical protein